MNKTNLHKIEGDCLYRISQITKGSVNNLIGEQISIGFKHTLYEKADNMGDLNRDKDTQYNWVLKTKYSTWIFKKKDIFLNIPDEQVSHTVYDD